MLKMFMQTIRNAVLCGATSAALLGSVTADEKQCVTNDGDYMVTVDWYKPTDVIVDNSRPWENRLLIRRDRRIGTGACGINLETGREECQGVHVAPYKTQLIRNLAQQQNRQSCVTSPTGNMFAVVRCEGCSVGKEVVLAAAGSVMGVALPGGVAEGAWFSALDSQGVGIGSALNTIASPGSQRIRVNGEISNDLTIHDTSDLEDTYDMNNVIYIGTPEDIETKGSFISPHWAHANSKTPQYAYRYTVEIDCYMATNAFFQHVQHTDTRDTVTVHFMKDGRILDTESIEGDNINCGATGADTKWHSKSLAEEVDAFRIEITGENAFLMDEVKASYYQVGLAANGSRSLHIGGGVDDLIGVCLSTDRTDTFGEYMAVPCAPYRDFPVFNF